MIPLLTEILGLAAAGVVLVGAIPFLKKLPFLRKEAISQWKRLNVNENSDANLNV
jgi:hypothetical protein